MVAAVKVRKNDDASETSDTVVIAAAHHIQPPPHFEFSKPEGWPKWRKRFERYLLITNYNEKADREKIDLLLYLMGDKSEDIMLQIVDDNYNELLAKLDGYFKPRKNVIFQRYAFNKRSQKEDETVAEYVRQLHVMAESCDFGNLKEELIGDRLVVGVKYQKSSERMQLRVCADLNLNEAVTIAQQVEALDTESFSKKN